MKKVSLLGFILAATTAQLASADVVAEGAVAVAQPQAGCPKAFQGFHLGGNIGYGVGWGKSKLTNNITETTTSATRGFRGVDGGIGVGYTHRLCNWALGIEFDANWTGTKGSHTLSGPFESFSHKTRLRNSLQLLGRLGYVMREIAMPFIGLGWDNSQWKHTATFNELNGAGVVVDTDTGSRSKRLNSFLWKVGVDFLATKHVVLGFEYTGTYGGKTKLTSKNDAFTASIKPQYNKFALTAKIVY